MANRRIDPLELRRMVEAGKTYREIAHHFNVSVSGVQQAVERIGMQKKALSHKKFIPWTLDKEHVHTGPATSLRNLSKVAQGAQVPMAKLNTALRWAYRLEEAGLDIDYTPEAGFFEKPAKEPSHIHMVLQDVQRVTGE
ncbi:hypothetical protein Ssi03_13490 [Sphaerisporangium siamense]|uniref:Transposase n=1 Tax=Sphaerisporangium siamense TaxID=795645 RepID=A0A7W7D9T0_9ACTN|nr:hypothetical protein [Sphaerisporangium siamense]MBB4702882.1 transposase [Sphaerisporangium siamense]GII83359.1 hypothetical protein Ssi03_13490 [Sphaerisporangium siamense]